MDPTTTTIPDSLGCTQQHWEAKPAMRWLKRVFDDRDGDHITLTLQQAWVCRETGEVKWEDVPEVSE